MKLAHLKEARYQKHPAVDFIYKTPLDSTDWTQFPADEAPEVAEAITKEFTTPKFERRNMGVSGGVYWLWEYDEDEYKYRIIVIETKGPTAKLHSEYHRFDTVNEAKYHKRPYAQAVKDRVELEYERWIKPQLTWMEVEKDLKWGEWDVPVNDHRSLVADMDRMFGKHEEISENPGRSNYVLYTWQVMPEEEKTDPMSAGNPLRFEVEYRFDENGGTLLVNDTNQQ
jgi:hypothetical protein